MSAVASLEGITRARFERAWAELGPDQIGLDGTAPLWMTHDLLCLLETAPERPAEELAPQVRRLILENSFVAENGDSVIGDDWDAQVQQQVQRIVAVLEGVRQAMCLEGQSAEVPVTPLMCG